MIDTIATKINDFQGEYTDIKYFNELINKIDNLRNCKIRKKSDEEIEIILSFPRFYSRTNAYLLTKSKECKQVIREFITSFFKEKYIHNDYNNWIKDKIRIKLIRVDVPITYLMNKDKCFNDYRNVFCLLENIYKKDSKRMGKRNDVETIILFDGKTKDSSNSKITIYNQHRKFENICSTSINKLEKEFRDLKYRIRIELSKRIRRANFTVKEFKYFDFYENYIYKYAQDISEVLFDEDKIEDIWQKQIKLLVGRYSKSSAKLETFLWENLDDIWDYKIITKVLDRVIENDNTYYKKCSQAKEFLKKEKRKLELFILELEIY